jgi:type I restriction enzyme, S subunit
MKLAADWKLLKVFDIAENIQYGYTESSSKEEIGPKFLRITDIQNNKVSWESVPYCSIDADSKEKYLLKDGDLLFARTGATVGKSFLIKGNFPESVFASYLIRVHFKEQVLDKYVYNYFQSLHYWKQITEGQVGIGQPNVNGTKLGQLTVPIAPLKQQQQIVSKIEELFSELDKGIEELKTAQQQLKVYRQAVLKWAFEGKLTNEHVNDGKLPEGWEWVKLNDVAKKITDGEHFRPPTQKTGIPFLSAKDVRDNGVSFQEPLYISEETAEKALQRCNPERGDILIVSRGATVGRMCIVKTENVFCLLGSVILIKVKSELSSEFLTYILKSPQINRKLISISGATAQQAIYLRDIKEIHLPCPSIEEQQQIVHEIESRLSLCDKIEETIADSLKQGEGLRQSILKDAFSGKLILT